jgi:hypothetical protein
MKSKTNKKENGFFAYEEITDLANRVYGNRGPVQVQASIFEDDYIVFVGGLEIMQGNTADIRAKLLSLQGVRS